MVVAAVAGHRTGAPGDGLVKIAVFGRTGQVATELARREHGASIHAFGREDADFADPDAVEHCVRELNADAIINAVAYTAVDKSEAEEKLATLINGTSVGRIAQVAAERELPFVHISTDYVFDGKGERPWAPDDAVGPLGAYGRSKLAGEQAVLDAGGTAGILRTSWVFSAHGSNFVKTMLRLAETRDQLTIVADQVGGPTPAAAIAEASVALCRNLAKGGPSGVYHFSGAPDVSWADFAREIFWQTGRQVTVEDITTADFPTPAQRPANSRLNCQSLGDDHGIPRPDWKAGLADVLKELKAT